MPAVLGSGGAACSETGTVSCIYAHEAHKELVWNAPPAPSLHGLMRCGAIFPAALSMSVITVSLGLLLAFWPNCRCTCSIFFVRFFSFQ